MTQHTLDPRARRVVGVTVDLEDLTATSLTDGVEVTIRQHWSDGLRGAIYSKVWEGAMVDYLPELGQAVVHAFLYGVEGEVTRAAFGVEKAARRHAKTRNRVG